MLEAVAAFVAWLGGATIVVADARRGLAVGTALAGLGLAVAAWPVAGWAGATVLAAGAAAAAARRWTAGPAGWRLMPPGSTPRLVLSVAGGLVALWLGVAVMSGPPAALRFASLAVIAMVGGRMLSSEDPAAAQTAFAVVALAVGAAAGLSTPQPDLWPYLAAAAVAAAVAWIPQGAPRAA